MGHCKDCKFWLKDKSCDKVGRAWSFNLNLSGFDIYATAHDDSGMEVYLITAPDFGCTLFEVKK